MKKIETLLYFGSFNPIHNGHTGIARYVVEEGLCDELWYVVSPQNPLKSADSLVGDLDRLRMVEIAAYEQLGGLPVKVSDVEFGLPKPSYTIDTLNILEDRYPHNSFSLLTGADIMKEIDRWREHESLLARYKFYVYPREGSCTLGRGDNIYFLDNAPVFEYSSTDVRRCLHEGGDISGMVSPGVEEYISEKRLWT